MRREKWVALENYDGYEISNQGRVRSVSRTRLVNGVKRHYVSRILRTNVCSRGFVNVTMCIYGKRVTKRLHRLVADTFLPKVPGKKHVHHRDDDRGNNKVSNLMRVSFIGKDYYNV